LIRSLGSTPTPSRSLYNKAHESGILSQSSACNRSYRNHRSGIHLGPYRTLSGAKTKAPNFRSFTLWEKCLDGKEAEAAEIDCNIRKATVKFVTFERDFGISYKSMKVVTEHIAYLTKKQMLLNNIHDFKFFSFS
jgi:hypothetical protein